MIRNEKLQDRRLTLLRPKSKSFSNIQKPIIPKRFLHIGLGVDENTRSYNDLASIVSNHTTEKDIEWENRKREEFKRKGSSGIINGKYFETDN